MTLAQLIFYVIIIGASIIGLCLLAEALIAALEPLTTIGEAR